MTCLLAFSGTLERIAGWLSGATPDDFAKAFKNLHDWLGGLPIAGSPAVQNALTIASLLAAVVTAWLVFFRSDGPLTDLEEGELNPARAKKRMICHPCEGTGQVAERTWLFGSKNEMCPTCKGHGSYETDLWSQPDCASCEGRGRQCYYSGDFQKIYGKCFVCDGHGKRPYEPVIPSEREKKLNDFLSSFRNLFVAVVNANSIQLNISFVNEMLDVVYPQQFSLLIDEQAKSSFVSAIADARSKSNDHRIIWRAAMNYAEHLAELEIKKDRQGAIAPRGPNISA